MCVLVSPLSGPLSSHLPARADIDDYGQIRGSVKEHNMTLCYATPDEICPAHYDLNRLNDNIPHLIPNTRVRQYSTIPID